MEHVIFRVVGFVGAIVALVSLAVLWPSIAGKFLLAGVILLAFVPRLRKKLLEAVKKQTAASGATPPKPDAFDLALAPVFQILIGGILGLIVICGIEDYLAICYFSVDVKLGDQTPGQVCPGEPGILWVLNSLHKAKDPFGDYSGYVFVALALLGLPLAVFYLRKSPTLVVQTLGGTTGDWIVRIANALVAVSIFSFWPVVDGSPTELSRVIAALRQGAEYESQNNFFYATTQRQERIGRDLLKQLQGKELPKDQQEQANKQRERIKRIYRAIANTDAEVRKLDPQKATELKDRMSRTLVWVAARSGPGPACRSSPGTVCPDQVGQLPGAYRYQAREQERVSERAATRVSLEQEVHFPLTVAIEQMLRDEYGDKDPEAIRSTARVVLILVDNADPEMGSNFEDELENRATLAETEDREARSRSAYLRCMDLASVLTKFLKSGAGQKILEQIVQSGRNKFIEAHPWETRAVLSSGDLTIQEALRFASAEASSEGGGIRKLVNQYLHMPSGISEQDWGREKGFIAQLIANILRAACLDGLTDEQFADRLNKLVT
jgi:hypothetical protein